MIMLSRRFMVQSTMIRQLNFFFLSVESSGFLEKGAIIFQKAEGEALCLFNMLEKGCSLVFSDGVIQGNAGF